MKQMYLYFIMMVIMFILVSLVILISVAFLTLLERKFLSYIQFRKGPNKLGIIGLIQPFSDAIKLMFKEMNLMMKINYMYYIFSPVVSFILILMMWLIYPIWVNCLNLGMGLLYLMCCFSFGVYGFMMAGWSSNSVYAMLGSVRSLAQSISYEVSLSIIMIMPMLLVGSLNFVNLYKIQVMGNWLFMFLWPLGILFLLSLLAELNRTPFDFSEGESELVSGFNIEYSSVGFILIFLSEYASILFLSMLFSLFYLGGNFMSMIFYLKILLISIMIIWIRGSFPRFRYDLLMYLCWIIVLPFSLNFMVYIIYFKNLIF